MKTGPGAFAPVAPPRPNVAKPATPLVRSYTPLKLEVQRGAKELVVDEFVDTYFRERPKTIRGPRLDELPLPPPEPPAAGEARPPADEESGIRALGATRDEIELSIAEHEEDIIALEARLADRDEQVESMQSEMLRLQMELEALKRQRSASSRPPAADPAPGTSPAPAAVAGPATAGGPPARALYPYAVAPDEAMTERIPRKRSAGWVVAMAVVVIGGGGAAAVLALRSSTDSVAPAPPSTSALVAPEAASNGAPPSAKPERPPAKPEPTAAEPDVPTPPPSAVASAPRAPSPSAAAPADPASGALPPASDVEEAGLLSFQAHLTVHSNIDAEVVVQGQPVGRTNQKLLVRCGPRNVRIRDDRGWRSAGEHVRITCMHAVTVPIVATP